MIKSGQQPYPASIMLDEFSFSATVKEKIKQHEAKMAEQQAQQQEIAKQKMIFDSNLAQQKQTTDAFKSLPAPSGPQQITSGVRSE